jgi:hypothetical protein
LPISQYHRTGREKGDRLIGAAASWIIRIAMPVGLVRFVYDVMSLSHSKTWQREYINDKISVRGVVV